MAFSGAVPVTAVATSETEAAARAQAIRATLADINIRAAVEDGTNRMDRI